MCFKAFDSVIKRNKKGEYYILTQNKIIFIKKKK